MKTVKPNLMQSLKFNLAQRDILCKLLQIIVAIVFC